MDKTVALVMAGGVGERLRPLTDSRAKPAVPFGGKYRLIDFTLSNCVNSDIRRVYVLTQYKSTSLQRHIQEGWGISAAALGDFVYTVPAQQKLGPTWYRGTADAIRQNLDLVTGRDVTDVIILSGDHIYKMDYSQILKYHRERAGSLTVATVSVKEEEAVGRLGVLEVDASGRVLTCEEKPRKPKLKPGAPGYVLASMGIYVFRTSALGGALEGKARDFAKDVIPRMLSRGHSVLIYDFEKNNRVEGCVVVTREGGVSLEIVPKAPDSAYWRDVGTIDSYFQASMEMLGNKPLFDVQSAQWPIRTHRRPLPPTRFSGGGSSRDSIISDGCLVRGLVRSSILSPRVVLERGSSIERAVVFDNVLIGQGARIRKAIIDKESVIQPGATLGFDLAKDEEQGCSVTESGIVVVPKATTINAL